MSEAASPLDRLCELHGIAGEYRDIWGRRRPVSRKTRRALLEALGVTTDSDAAMEEALAQAEAAAWSRVLPPVMVVWEDAGRLEVPVGGPGEKARQPHEWTLMEEGGGHRRGELRPADLGAPREQVVGGETWQRRTLVLEGLPPPGYHRLELRALEDPAPPAAMSLIVAPRTCFQPAAVRDGGRVWGPNLQLYSVRSSRNWGIGDFTDLLRVVELAAGAGAGLVGLNPLHALFPHDPSHASPYSPSSRLFLNVLYLDVEAVPDFEECAEARAMVADEAFQSRLRALRAADLVSYREVAAVKMEVLKALYRHFRDRHLEAGGPRGEAFQRFRAERGERLRHHALYEALQGWLHARDPAAWGWPAWPPAYRRPDAEAVAAFAAEHGDRIELFEYLQWQAHLQLEAAGRRAFELGLGIGLYQDLAVSVDAGGAEAWANQDLYVFGARIGSPPDDFNLKGQDWGLPPWSPERLRERAYAPFIETLREGMRNAGVVRIDHVMALMRLFWVPPGQPPVEGTYVSYPFEDLLGILALESRRNQCLVIGEDLGTVPEEVRAALRPMGVLSYRLLYFEKDDEGGFKAPADYDPQTLVAAGTHDLPTLTGYWQGRDLELRDRLDLFPSDGQRREQVVGRAEDRVRLLMALEQEGLLPPGMSIQAMTLPEMTTGLAVAIHRFLARTPAAVMVAQMEDVFGQPDQVNLPGTTGQHPNWRHKLAPDLEHWAGDPRFDALVAALREERGSAVSPAVEPRPGRPAPAQATIPGGTYRLQLHGGFTFDDGAAVVPYLQQLGVSHCYASPCLQARPGSPHGYDITDHTRLNAELGGDEAFARLAETLRRHHMGQIMDMVPNHMAVMGGDNDWWLDVLENGQAAAHAGFFDIDWAPLKDSLRGKVLLPVLGDHYGSVLDNGDLELTLDTRRGAFCVRYYEHVFPVDPREYPRIIAHGMERLEERLGATEPRLLELQSLVTAFGNLPERGQTGEEARAERARDKEVHKASLARQYRDADIGRFVDENVETFNSPGGVGLLHGLLEHQAWRLAYWRVASDEINYRRFFDINELAGLRMENPEVFEATHERVLGLVQGGDVQGLRIDHPDGLYDPAGYMRRLQHRVAAPRAVAVPGAGNALEGGEGEEGGDRPLYLLVEKILAGHERLREDWAVHGTTGYDFANLVNGLFVAGDAEEEMDRLYREVTAGDGGLDRVVYDSKRLIMATSLASELNVLAQQLSRIAEEDRHTRDFTLGSLRQALREVVACFPVYRTYVDAGGVGEDDRRHVDWAVGVAKRRSPAADVSVFDFIRGVLLTQVAEGRDEAYRERVLGFTMRFQQYTAPVMAKGLEDTAFYRYVRLAALNEVGGDPERFGVSVAAFHHQNQERARVWPHTMVATATHDSKRGEDVRARLDVLSELPREWGKRVHRWAHLNRSRKRELDTGPAPSAADEYLLYQTLVGAWPLEPLDEGGLAAFRERVGAYMLKAVREAKVHTSWINTDAAYEEAVVGFVNDLLADPDRNPFLTGFLAFQELLGRAGLINGLAQVLLKLTVPGVPDIYQGSELWDLSLVDPDNRRPVDYGRRQALLHDLEAALAEGDGAALARALLDGCEDGRAKLFVTWRALGLRADHPALFRDGDYLPLAVAGARADHVCAFARRHEGQAAVTVVPRLSHVLCQGRAPVGRGVWADTRVEVPGAQWESRLTGVRLEAPPDDRGCRWLDLADVLADFPVALLLAVEDHGP